MMQTVHVENDLSKQKVVKKKSTEVINFNVPAQRQVDGLYVLRFATSYYIIRQVMMHREGTVHTHTHTHTMLILYLK